MAQTIHEKHERQLNINFRTLATEIQVRIKISQFITLLPKRSDSLPIHREMFLSVPFDR